MSHSRKRQPNHVVVKGILGKYKKVREEDTQDNLSSSLGNFATPNNLKYVYSVYNACIEKLKLISKASSLRDKAKIWCDLREYLGTEAHQLQRNLAPSSFTSIFFSNKESEHADHLMAASCYIGHFASVDVFPEFEKETAQRIKDLQNAYIALDTEIKNGLKLVDGKDSILLSKEEVAKLNKDKDVIIVKLACYGNIEHLANDEHKRKDLYPGFHLPKDNDKESRNATVTYQLQTNVPTALQKHFFEFLSEHQEFETAEKKYIVPFCEENNLPVEFVIDSGNITQHEIEQAEIKSPVKTGELVTQSLFNNSKKDKKNKRIEQAQSQQVGPSVGNF